MFVFFFFKQKTAYEMRISDWSSDVCSSDLLAHLVADVQVELAVGLDVDRIRAPAVERRGQELVAPVVGRADLPRPLVVEADQVGQIGRASCRERVCQYV